jgi:hypothetical protein
VGPLVPRGSSHRLVIGPVVQAFQRLVTRVQEGVGYRSKTLSKLAGRGALERVSRGVYRVPFLPGRYGKASRSLRSAKRR